MNYSVVSLNENVKWRGRSARLRKVGWCNGRVSDLPRIKTVFVNDGFMLLVYCEKYTRQTMTFGSGFVIGNSIGDGVVSAGSLLLLEKILGCSYQYYK